MVAPSKNFTVIPDSDIDPDSPITTGLMTELRDNDIHLEEWLGLSFTAAQDHDHDGVNSAAVALVFDQITNQGATATGAQTDIATITVASADLPANRDAMIIASGHISHAGGGAFPGTGTVRLLVDAVAKQTIPTKFLNATEEQQFALSEIVTLSTGSDRIIKVQGVTTAGNNHVYADVNLFSVLIN